MTASDCDVLVGPPASAPAHDPEHRDAVSEPTVTDTTIANGHNQPRHTEQSTTTKTTKPPTKDDARIRLPNSATEEASCEGTRSNHPNAESKVEESAAAKGLAVSKPRNNSEPQAGAGMENRNTCKSQIGASPTKAKPVPVVRSTGCQKDQRHAAVSQHAGSEPHADAIAQTSPGTQETSLAAETCQSNTGEHNSDATGGALPYGINSLRHQSGQNPEPTARSVTEEPHRNDERTSPQTAKPTGRVPNSVRCRQLIFPLIPIVPTSCLYLSVRGLPGEQRFAQVFRDTWRQIPFACRRHLVRYWRMNHQGLWGVPLPQSQRILRETGSLSVMDAEHGPVIQLIPDRCHFAHRAFDAVGMCSRWGFKLQFLEPIVSHMSDRHVGILIAHELGHAHLYACGDSQDDDFEAEPAVADVICTWGFDDYELDGAINAALAGANQGTLNARTYPLRPPPTVSGTRANSNHENPEK